MLSADQAFLLKTLGDKQIARQKKVKSVHDIAQSGNYFVRFVLAQFLERACFTLGFVVAERLADEILPITWVRNRRAVDAAYDFLFESRMEIFIQQMLDSFFAHHD